jgi:hypothetical protein
MKRMVAALLCSLFSLALANCVPFIQQEPDNEKVRQNHDKASDDLRREENKQD